jgi:hypothetical protein
MVCPITQYHGNGMRWARKCDVKEEKKRIMRFKKKGRDYSIPDCVPKKKSKKLCIFIMMLRLALG